MSHAMCRYLLALAPLAVAALCGCMRLASKEPPMTSATLWPVDPLVKVFQDAQPPETPPAPPEALAARNEYESLQFVLRSTEPLTNVYA